MTPRPSMLVIDDEDSICTAFQRFFERRGWDVTAAASALEGRDAFARIRPTVAFLDVRLPDRSGLDLLDELGDSRSNVIVITAYGGLDTVVRAIHGKAYDYLVKPLDLDQALALASRIRDAAPRNGSSIATASAAPPANRIVGDSPRIQEIYKRIARFAASNSPVLIQGETGTGKELVARAIHQFGPRAARPFAAINCGAIPATLIESELFGHVRGAFTGADTDRTGKFESAAGGCLLLDEIGDLPLAVQVKLLRVLDTGEIEKVGSSKTTRLDVRILAATNKDLAAEVAAGRFRSDLYYRLAVLKIDLPPLRDRREDIPALAAHFLHAAASSVSFANVSAKLDPSALAVLAQHNWPGNVRELKSAIEHAVSVAPHRTILPEDLPHSVRNGLLTVRDGSPIVHDGPSTGVAPGDVPDARILERAAIAHATRAGDNPAGRWRATLETTERALIQHALDRFHGNQSAAADYLGVHRNTLRLKLREFDIPAPAEPDEPRP